MGVNVHNFGNRLQESSSRNQNLLLFHAGDCRKPLVDIAVDRIVQKFHMPVYKRKMGTAGMIATEGNLHAVLLGQRKIRNLDIGIRW